MIIENSKKTNRRVAIGPNNSASRCICRRNENICQEFISHGGGEGEAQDQAADTWFLVRAHFLACKQRLSDCILRWERECALMSSFLCKGTHPTMGAPPSWPHLNLITSRHHTGGLGLQHTNPEMRGHKIRTITWCIHMMDHSSSKRNESLICAAMGMDLENIMLSEKGQTQRLHVTGFHLYGVSHSVVFDSFATPWTVAHHASLFMEFSRQEYWSGLPFPSPGDLPDSGFKPGDSCIAGRFFTVWVTMEAPSPPFIWSVQNRQIHRDRK